jgi:hypothetical protein
MGMGLSQRQLSSKRSAKRAASPKKTKIVRTSRTAKASSDIRESASLPPPPACTPASK